MEWTQLVKAASLNQAKNFPCSRRLILVANVAWHSGPRGMLLVAAPGTSQLAAHGLGYLPAWGTGVGPNDQARELAEVLLHADTGGLNPEEYSAIALAASLKSNERDVAGAKDPKALADFDILCMVKRDMDRLDREFEKGEISREEYLERKKEIEGRSVVR